MEEMENKQDDKKSKQDKNDMTKDQREQLIKDYEKEL